MKPCPRQATIKDISNNKVDLSKAKKINSKELSSSLRNDHGLEPEKEKKIYDSYVDEIIQTVGQEVSDQMFEQAKDIIYRKAIEVQLGDDTDSVNNDQNEEHNTKVEDILSNSNTIKINKVPSPKRKIKEEI